jgi:hypothetical protein
MCIQGLGHFSPVVTVLEAGKSKTEWLHLVKKTLLLHHNMVEGITEWESRIMLLQISLPFLVKPLISS